ncbi:MAG: DNA primase [Thermodesulfobacteriota bacterium]
MIPQDTIEEVRQRASIVDIISERVTLKQRGANYIGLCPFHSEKTPSFTVSEEKKIFYCFGCQAKGNVVTFLMQYEQLSFPEAVKTIASRVGIEIPQEEKRGGAERNALDGLYNANRIAAEFFHSQLLGRDGKAAREYLKGRGLDAESVDAFNIGYAASSWEGLVRHLSGKGCSLDDAERVGLIKQKDRGHYDRFRERIIFPIYDTSRRVIGFGGRSMGDREPKYLNSPESPLFRKGEVLYGLLEARQGIRQKGFALIVEGYFDLIALHTHGFTNSVATMGTALTSGHIRRLRGSAREIYTLFDGDKAGIKAAVRGLDLFLGEGVPSRAVFLPSELDPDDFIRSEGANALESTIAEAPPLMELFLRNLAEGHDITSAAGKVSYMEEALPRLRRIGNVTERGHYSETIATLLSVGVDVVYAALKGGEPKGRGRPSGGGGSARRGGRSNTQSNARSGIQATTQNETKGEEQIIKVLLFHPELLNDAVKDAVHRFRSPLLQGAARFVIEAIDGGGKVDESSIFDATLGEGEKSLLTRAIMEGDKDIKEAPEEILRDCCRKVQSSGALGEGTQQLLKSLEEAGRSQEADLLRKGAESCNVKK